MYLMAQAGDFAAFTSYVFGYMLVYMPTQRLSQFGFLIK